MSVGREAVEAAAARIAPHARVTPLLSLGEGELGLPHPLLLKLEGLQRTGSFKARGALNALLAAPVPPAGVIAASGGNHGLAVAWAAARLGHRAEVFVPEVIGAAKLARLRASGAAVTVAGRVYAEALEASRRRAEVTGARAIHAYDQPEVVAGQGTLARELERQAGGPPDVALVAVGGGGLLAGLLAWWERRVRLVAVEPEAAPTLHRALAAGAPLDVEVSGLAADSLGARRAGAIAFELARRGEVTSLLVPDAAIAAAQARLWAELRVVAEPGGAAALAALLSGAWRPEPGQRVAAIVCGANADLVELAGRAAAPAP